ncbi:metallothionein [Pseudomonas sp. SWRI10]|uniref:Metallothionein n=1 Tax=Pseudomonas urmiensis TaxID=2745493 RepID=A0A923FYW7_9PSED|nr:metallothionein [Pseudomonas urmiensis]
MKEQRCACPHCNCTVDANAVQQGGKAYCCEACATGHRNGERCRMGVVPAARLIHLSRPKFLGPRCGPSRASPLPQGRRRAKIASYQKDTYFEVHAVPVGAG